MRILHPRPPHHCWHPSFCLAIKITPDLQFACSCMCIFVLYFFVKSFSHSNLLLSCNHMYLFTFFFCRCHFDSMIQNDWIGILVHRVYTSVSIPIFRPNIYMTKIYYVARRWRMYRSFCKLDYSCDPIKFARTELKLGHWSRYFSSIAVIIGV